MSGMGHDMPQKNLLNIMMGLLYDLGRKETSLQSDYFGEVNQLGE